MQAFTHRVTHFSPVPTLCHHFSSISCSSPFIWKLTIKTINQLVQILKKKRKMKDVDSISVPQQSLWLLNLFLRLTVLPFAAASIWVMATNNQAVEPYGEVEFSNLTGLKYLVWINAISTGYALVSALLSYFRWFNPDWVLFVMDQVTTYLLVTSGSAVIETLYLVHEGDREVSWSEVCSYYGKFCSKTKITLVVHLLALACFLALSLISGYRLFSKFEAPSSVSSTKGEIGRQGE